MRKDQIIENVCKTLKEDKVITDYRYDHFEEYEAIPPPFAVYRRVAPQNFSADGIVYHHGENVDLDGTPQIRKRWQPLWKPSRHSSMLPSFFIN